MNKELELLGENIRAARRRLKISQEELAERAGLHRTYVSGIENGARNLSFCSLVSLARGLGMTVSQLTQDVDPGVALPLVRQAPYRLRVNGSDAATGSEATAETEVRLRLAH